MYYPSENTHEDMFTVMPLPYSNSEQKTALTLLEQIQGLKEEALREPSLKKILELSIDEKHGTMVVTGANGPIKVFSDTRKLLLIKTAHEGKAHFKINRLKKGRYLLEAEHQFFEFVR